MVLKSNVKILVLKKNREEDATCIRLHAVDSQAILESPFSLEYL